MLAEHLSKAVPLDSAASASGLPAGIIQRVSTSAKGAPASAGSTTCALALFASDAANLVTVGTNGRVDLFLQHLDSGALQRVPALADGAQIAAGGSCQGTTMTPDSRLAALYGRLLRRRGVRQEHPDRPAGAGIPTCGHGAAVQAFLGAVLSDDGRNVVFLTLPEQVCVGASTPG